MPQDRIRAAARKLRWVSKKILHGGIQTINYTYNIRNWLKSTSSEKFTETLYYQDGEDGNAYYNGNISLSIFGTGQNNMYIYWYDDLNRLTSATSDFSGYYLREDVGNYDKNGNIQSILRGGYVYDYVHNVIQGPIDNLTLTYNGNQLKNVNDVVDQTTVITTNDFVNKTDATYPTEYLYDANGNQYADLNKGIAWIRYNSLNLPQKVQFRNRTTNVYIYDASGVKHTDKYNYSTSTSLIPLGATTTENTLASTFQTDYCGNYIYQKSGTANPVLTRVLTPEGYIQTSGTIPLNSLGNWTYVYFLKDHLGNTRMNLTSYYLSRNTNKSYSASNQIDYYPFGMERSTDRTVISSTGQPPLFGSGTNPYLYNGKEIDRMNGLNENDYGGRWYDPAVARWPTMDPLVEMDYSVSPYAYCGDNPINRIDPDGRLQFKPEYKEPLIDLQTGEITRSSPSLNTERVYLKEQPKYYTADANESVKDNKDNGNSLGAVLGVGLETVWETLTAAEILVGGLMAAVVICPGDTPLDHKKAYKPVPADLPGFPGAKRTKSKAGRARWNLPNGDIGEWDSQHGEVEVYDKTGKKHKGAYDPKSGEKKKDGDPKRKTEPK